MSPEKYCPICRGEGWVCENHKDVKWDYGEADCCEGAGIPCECNQVKPPWEFKRYDE
jgi:hypothetical protein